MGRIIIPSVILFSTNKPKLEFIISTNKESKQFHTISVSVYIIIIIIIIIIILLL